MKSSIIEVEFGYSNIYFSEGYTVTYASGRKTFYCESKPQHLYVPKTVLDFVKSAASISSHTSDGHTYYIYRKE